MKVLVASRQFQQGEGPSPSRAVTSHWALCREVSLTALLNFIFVGAAVLAEHAGVAGAADHPHPGRPRHVPRRPHRHLRPRQDRHQARGLREVHRPRGRRGRAHGDRAVRLRRPDPAGPPQGHLPDRGRGGLHRVLAPQQGRGRGPGGGQLRQAGEEAAAAGEAGQGVGQPRVGPVEARHHGRQVH